MDDGEKLLEVEFPPLPAAIMDSEDVSAYEVSKANLRLAIDFGKAFSLNGTSVAVLVVRLIMVLTYYKTIFFIFPAIVLCT